MSQRNLAIAVIDYGASNLRSVVKALEKAGCPPYVTSDPRDVLRAQAVVFPGQGASDPSMKALRKHGLDKAIKEAIAQGTPYLGVCLGLELLLDSSEEGGEACLGLVPGRVRRLPHGLKVPHMGWNQVEFSGSHPVFQGLPPKPYFYFVHSYYAEPQDPSLVAGQTTYGVTFCSVIARENLVAVQFHPEKSGDLGLSIYRNFLAFASQGIPKGSRG